MGSQERYQFVEYCGSGKGSKLINVVLLVAVVHINHCIRQKHHIMGFVGSETHCEHLLERSISLFQILESLALLLLARSVGQLEGRLEITLWRVLSKKLVHLADVELFMGGRRPQFDCLMQKVIGEHLQLREAGLS